MEFDDHDDANGWEAACRGHDWGDAADHRCADRQGEQGRTELERNKAAPSRRGAGA
jgi:hypothetical protein